MKKITWIIFVFAFILLRPYQLQNSGMMYTGDDYDYMSHATSLVFFQFPSYAKESFGTGQGIPLGSIGSALLASPFVFLTSIIDRTVGNEVIVKRTASNVHKSWTAFGFTLASVFYLWIACLFLYKGLTFYFERQVSSLTVILTVLAQGVPLYAFRRPVFSHIYELFLQSLFLFIMLRLDKLGGYILGGKQLKDLGEAVFIGLLAGSMSLTRTNNIFMSLVWPIILFSLYYPGIAGIRIVKMILVSYLTIASLIFIFQIWPIFYNLHDINQYSGYINSEQSRKYFYTLYNPFFYIKRLGHLIWGIDWGLIFTAPYLVLGLFSLALIKEYKIRARLIYLLVPMAFTLYGTLSFRSQGGWYGYRYLIFSLIPIIVYPMAKLILLSKKKTLFYYSVILISIMPILSMLSFEGNNTNLTLNVVEQGFGVADWGNNTYQLGIYKTILTNPIQYLIGILKGGPLYLVYLASTFLGLKKYLPGVVLEKYTIFQLSTLIKTVAVYLFPFALLLVYKKLKWLKES
ncbi:MAG: hypothetical protein NTW13_01860 [Candidatus Omnitrophica bacterium]|nr:hypothetical protein [Candidatus Omnitrophota bacterium]